jgi:hypothetical protein
LSTFPRFSFYQKRTTIGIVQKIYKTLTVFYRPQFNLTFGSLKKAMAEEYQKHWFKDYKAYWAAYLSIIVVQAAVTLYQFPKPTVDWYFILFGAFLLINVIVALLILLLTWPARRNLAFSRYIKILIAFSSVYVLSQLVAALIVYLQG